MRDGVGQGEGAVRASLLPPAPGLATVLIAAELGADCLVWSLSLVLSVAARSE